MKKLQPEDVRTLCSRMARLLRSDPDDGPGPGPGPGGPDPGAQVYSSYKAWQRDPSVWCWDGQAARVRAAAGC